MVECNSDSSAFLRSSANATVKELLKLVNIFRSYYKNKVGRFFETQCRLELDLVFFVTLFTIGTKMIIMSLKRFFL